ncbi:MAG TPA: restriction endonuclease subunit S [Candidatus Coproplasma stercoripullorum]|uniref:Restriction endonuclease subunit S n=1 Tax=Candidatus Coproplasma stercoripullorum TaxID=2840751 RepID=A0A9D1DAR3_9FIRM|nr:restriction endonuclease subunit S [Candidatus Coproplasma stercoripullorum]
MALSNYKLGELISEVNRYNTDKLYGIDVVRGVSNHKTIMKTKASIDADVIAKFLIIQPDEFVYNPRTTRMGEKVGLAYNDTNCSLLFSFNNIGFKIKDKSQILPQYLYIYFCRNEFDRYARINSWGSATELFTFKEMCDIDIELPPIEVQQKYVDIYQGMVNNQKAYERGLEDLKLVCDGYIEDLRRKLPSEPIGKYLSLSDRRNDIGLGLEAVRGISTSKEFIETKADMEGVGLANYKLVQPNYFAYVGDTSRRGDKISLALNTTNETFLVSSISYVFTTSIDLLAEYLMLFFSRDEFNRYARFNSWGSARESFNFDDMCNVKIPIPAIEVQKSIADIFKVYNTRKRINEQLKAQIKDICPILIKGSIDEARR